MSNQVVTDHALGLLADDLGGLDNMDTALHTTGKVTLASTTSLNLGLNNEASLVAETLGNLKCFVSRACKMSLLHIDTVISH